MALREHAFAALLASIPLAAGLILFSIRGTPRPVVHDEFSYLFAADTFAHGRLTNPAHPLWPHFESFDLLSRPTFMSRKPPGQGLFLALGTFLAGKPIVGVLISIAAACLAIYWMLLAWMEPPWALLGAALALLHPLLFQWSVNYWGGGVALLGGALALGAWRRLLDNPSFSISVVFGLALTILANSRPLEGLILSLSLLAVLFWKKKFKKITLPLGLAACAAAAAMGYYNFKVTKSVFNFPYAEYEKAYNTAPLLLWKKTAPARPYRTKEFDEYFNHWQRRRLKTADTALGYAQLLKHKYSLLAREWLIPLPYGLLLAAALGGWAPRILSVPLVFFIIASTIPSRAFPFAYSSAPAGGLFFTLSALSLKRLGRWRWNGRPAGLALAAILFVWAASHALNSWMSYAQAPDESWSILKEDSARRLLAYPGRDLVLVRYGPGHSVHEEWVYNEADINASPVIWARSLSPQEDRRLAEFYPDRLVWTQDVFWSETRLQLLSAPKISKP